MASPYNAQQLPHSHDRINDVAEICLLTKSSSVSSDTPSSNSDKMFDQSNQPSQLLYPMGIPSGASGPGLVRRNTSPVGTPWKVSSYPLYGAVPANGFNPIGGSALFTQSHVPNYTLAMQDSFGPGMAQILSNQQPVSYGSVTDDQLNSSYGYAFDRGNGRYVRLVPADDLPELDGLPRCQGPEGLIVLPLPRAKSPHAIALEAGHYQVPAINIRPRSTTNPGGSDAIQGTIDRIVATTGTSRPTRREKIYCDKWVHEGICAFTQQGCKYRHEMPMDKVTQKELGLFHGLPAWYKKEHGTHSTRSDSQSSGGDEIKEPRGSSSGGARRMTTSTNWRANDNRTGRDVNAGCLQNEPTSHPANEPYFKPTMRFHTPSLSNTTLKKNMPANNTTSLTNNSGSTSLMHSSNPYDMLGVFDEAVEDDADN